MKGQVFTVAKLHYFNGAVYFVAQEGDTSLSTLAKHSEETTKSGTAKHPNVRVRTLVRFAEGLGLVVRPDKTRVQISELGRRYYEARGKAKWSLSDQQKEILRDHILSDLPRTPTIHAITSLLSLVKKGYTGESLAQQYAITIGKEEAWKSDVTFEGFTKFGLSYLEELGFFEEDTGKTTVRNPKWTRDELILALDLYFRCPPSKTNKDNPEVISLSNLLNSLPIHPQKEGYAKFRNANGVYMKLCNFLRFDPDYSGSGLKAGGKLEEDIWNEFASDREKLSKTVEAIKTASPEVPRPADTETWQEDEEFEEGRVLTKLHKIRERAPSAGKKKKAAVLNKTGRLACEACGFDFNEFYGIIGKGVAECHHKRPVSELKKGEKTKISELSILCANCHRIIHKSRPMLSVERLKNLIS